MAGLFPSPIGSGGSGESSGGEFAYNGLISTPPVWVSDTQVSVAYVAGKSIDGTTEIEQSELTFDIEEIANGGVLINGPLTGTVAVASGSDLVTGVGTNFTEVFSPGDPILVIVDFGMGIVEVREVDTVTNDVMLNVTDNFTITGGSANYAYGGLLPDRNYYMVVTQNGGSLTSENPFQDGGLPHFPTTDEGAPEPYLVLPGFIYVNTAPVIVPFRFGAGYPEAFDLTFEPGYGPDNSMNPLAVLNEFATTGSPNLTTLSRAELAICDSALLHVAAVDGALNFTVHNATGDNVYNLPGDGYVLDMVRASMNGSKQASIEISANKLNLSLRGFGIRRYLFT